MIQLELMIRAPYKLLNASSATCEATWATWAIPTSCLAVVELVTAAGLPTITSITIGSRRLGASANAASDSPPN